MAGNKVDNHRSPIIPLAMPQKEEISMGAIRRIQTILWFVAAVATATILLTSYNAEHYRRTMPRQPTGERTIALDLGRSQTIFVTAAEAQKYNYTDMADKVSMFCGLISVFGLAYVKNRLKNEGMS